jgi:hypothetical protein
MLGGVGSGGEKPPLTRLAGLLSVHVLVPVLEFLFPDFNSVFDYPGQHLVSRDQVLSLSVYEYVNRSAVNVNDY